MSNLLINWFKISENDLKDKGFETSVNNESNDLSTSINIDSNMFVGTICFWKPNKFEFQFNDCETGDVILLESLELNNIEAIENHFKFIETKLNNHIGKHI